MAAVNDAHSRDVPDWAIAHHRRTDDALTMAMALRGPAGVGDLSQRSLHPICVCPDRRVRRRTPHHRVEGTHRNLLCIAHDS